MVNGAAPPMSARPANVWPRMATAPHSAAAPPADAPAQPGARPRAHRPAATFAAAVATVVGVAVALRLAFDQYLNYDARYALLWGRDLARGLKPDYTADFAPTPHPLETVVSILAVPFGDGADPLLEWLILACFGLLVWLTYRLGEQLFGRWVGVVAALVVLTRPALQRDALLGYQDTAFACLIVGAVLLEARRPRRGEAVMGLLVVAGLMRPEGWALGGLYALWMFPAAGTARRVRLLALAAVAPVLWAALDLYATGDTLHSLHGTAELAEAVDRRRSPAQAPYWTLQYFGYALREPIVLGLPVGLAFAWRHRRRPALLPLAVVAVMTAVFMIGPVFGLPLIGRYVRTPAVLLALFYGLAVCGWLALPRGRDRSRWRIAGIVAAVLSLAFLPWHARMLADQRENLAERDRVYAQLEAVARAPRVAAVVARCPRVTGAEHRVMPHLRWWLDLPPFALSTVEAGASPPQPVIVLPRPGRATRRFYRDQYPTADPPPGSRRVAADGAWRVLAAPRCVTRPPA